MDDGQGQTGARVPGAGLWDPRYRSLDSWRGLACLLVVVHHAGYALSWADARGSGTGPWWRWLAVLAVKRMDLGVTLFFVISGYCIAASVESTRRKGGSPWAFLVRRFRRIYPPYWAALAGFLVSLGALEAVGLSRLFQGPRGVWLDAAGSLDWRQWLGNVTLTETWRPHVWGPRRNVFTGVAWSLCFEEQFYFLCFLVLLAAPRRFYAAIGAVTLAVVAARVACWQAGALKALRGTFPLLWHQFAVGLAVFFRLNVAGSARARRLVDLGLLGMLAAGLLAGGWETATAAAFGLVLVAARRWDEPCDRLAWLAPLRASGRRCYSIYLAHLPVGVVANHGLYELGLTGFWARALVMVPLVSAAGVAAGWAFHALVESRFLPSSGPVAGPRRAERLRPIAWQAAEPIQAVAS